MNLFSLKPEMPHANRLELIRNRKAQGFLENESTCMGCGSQLDKFSYNWQFCSAGCFHKKIKTDKALFAEHMRKKYGGIK